MYRYSGEFLEYFIISVWKYHTEVRPLDIEPHVFTAGSMLVYENMLIATSKAILITTKRVATSLTSVAKM